MLKLSECYLVFGFSGKTNRLKIANKKQKNFDILKHTVKYSVVFLSAHINASQKTDIIP